MTEQWLPVVGHELTHEVSNLGGVVALRPSRRAVLGSMSNGYIRVGVGGENDLIHRLVAKAFLPNPEGYPLVRHLDDVKTNNDVRNLKWGTDSQNKYDTVRNGINYHVNRTECPQGHEYTEANTYLRQGRGRECRACRKAIRVGRKLSDTDSRHGTANGYTWWGCRCNDCLVAHRQLKENPTGEKRAA